MNPPSWPTSTKAGANLVLGVVGRADVLTQFDGQAGIRCIPLVGIHALSGRQHLADVHAIVWDLSVPLPRVWGVGRRRSDRPPLFLVVRCEREAVVTAIKRLHTADGIRLFPRDMDTSKWGDTVAPFDRRPIHLELLTFLRHRVVRLPWRAQLAILVAFCSPGGSPKEVAACVGITRRHLDRSLAVANLQPLNWFCRASTVTRVLDFMHDAAPPANIVRALELGCVRSFARSLRVVLGCTSKEFTVLAKRSPRGIARLIANAATDVAHTRSPDGPQPRSPQPARSFASNRARIG